MVPSRNVIDLIKRFEGCKLEAYQDQADIWTVGYGTTGPGIVEGLTISQSTAEGMLLGHVKEVGLSLTDLIKVSLGQNMFDACVSLAYNIGMGNFRKSTLLQLINANDRQQAADEFLKWDHARIRGVETIDQGLLSRRAAERALFLS